MSTVEYTTSTNSIFDFRDIDDDELIRTDSGIYNVIYSDNA